MAFMRIQEIAVCLILVYSVRPSAAISQRRIYTLFTDPKSWNDASAICNSQFGNLVKLEGDRQIRELQFLDESNWTELIGRELLSASATSSEGVWTGLHEPFYSINNHTATHPDCEPVDPSTTFPYDVNGHCGLIKDSNYAIRMSECSRNQMFVCERYEGDCWFEPFLESVPAQIFTHILFTPNSTEPIECALECRNKVTGTGQECWGFNYFQTSPPACYLYMLNDAESESHSSTSASAFYVTPANRDGGGPPNSIFYVRRCFEGVLDKKEYTTYNSAPTIYPNTVCDTTPYNNTSTAATQICFCSTVEHPPIPEPKSSTEKAEELIQELTIESSNTSAALRKLTSAEDNRPSAQGVGYVGVALMASVFGGLFIMDLDILIAGLKRLAPLLKRTQSPEST